LKSSGRRALSMGEFSRFFSLLHSTILWYYEYFPSLRRIIKWTNNYVKRFRYDWNRTLWPERMLLVPLCRSITSSNPPFLMIRSRSMVFTYLWGIWKRLYFIRNKLARIRISIYRSPTPRPMKVRLTTVYPYMYMCKNSLYNFSLNHFSDQYY